MKADLGAEFGKSTYLANTAGIFWSYDGSQIYYWSDFNWAVVENDGSNKQVLECEICPENEVAWVGAASPEGSKIAIRYGLGRFILANSDLSNAKHVPLSGDIGHIQWSPDSSKMLLVGYNPRTIFRVMEAKTLKTYDLITSNPNGLEGLYPCGWSPDSQLVLFIGTSEGTITPDKRGKVYKKGLIFIQNIRGGDPTRLTRFDEGWESCPVWISDKE